MQGELNRTRFDDAWPVLAQEQAGVVGRAQLLQAGVSPAQVRRAERRRNWRTVLPGVYVTFTGPLPERTRIWAAVIYAGEGAVVLDLVLKTAQRRLTTPARLFATVSRRPRLRWRPLVLDLISDTADGVLSALERLYRDRVERAHGLPRANRNATRTRTRGTHRYWDVDYEQWNTLVELDGLAYHPEDERDRDDRKDNSGTLSGRRVLHYGWRSTYLSPCTVAAEVATVLGSQGWPGTLSPCGRQCTALSALAAAAG